MQSGLGGGSKSGTNQEDVVAEEVCAGCFRSPLEVSLVLTCSHRLCLNCAAQRLKSGPIAAERATGGRGSSAHIANCPICSSVTDVDPLAAQHLKEHRAALARAGGNGGALQPPMPEHEPQSQHQQQSQSQTQSQHAPRRIGMGPATTTTPPSPPQQVVLCGQCETAEAEVECQNCSEFFCPRCAAEVHRAGRMREHHLIEKQVDSSRCQLQTQRESIQTFTCPTALRGANASETPANCLSPRQLTVVAPSSSLSHSRSASATPTVLPPEDARHYFCPRHPAERLQFYCMDWDTECLCAECAVEAAGQGRNVLKVTKAYQGLASKIDDTIFALQRRSEANERQTKEAEDVRSDLESIIRKGKQDIQDSFRRLQSLLAQRESELLVGVDAFESSAIRAIQNRTAPAAGHWSALQDARSALRNVDAHGQEEVLALNAFSGIRRTVARLLEPQTGVDRNGFLQAVSELQADLHGSLDAQVAGVIALGSKIKEIRRKGAPTALSAS